MSEQPQQRSTEEVEAIKEDILTALETAIGPELGIDITNLELIYEVEFAEETGDTVIKMTLTTTGRPLTDVLIEQIHGVLEDIPKVNNIKVKLAQYPAWATGKMSRYARTALGIRQLLRS